MPVRSRRARRPHTSIGSTSYYRGRRGSQSRTPSRSSYSSLIADAAATRMPKPSKGPGRVQVVCFWLRFRSLQIRQLVSAKWDSLARTSESVRSPGPRLAVTVGDSKFDYLGSLRPRDDSESIWHHVRCQCYITCYITPWLYNIVPCAI